MSDKSDKDTHRTREAGSATHARKSRAKSSRSKRKGTRSTSNARRRAPTSPRVRTHETKVRHDEINQVPTVHEQVSKTNKVVQAPTVPTVPTHETPKDEDRTSEGKEGGRGESHEFRSSASARRKSPTHPSLTPPHEFFKPTERTQGPIRTGATSRHVEASNRALFFMKAALIVGMSICLAVLLLLTLARIKRRQMAATDDLQQARRGILGWAGLGPSAAEGGQEHTLLGKISVPVSICTVILASYLFYLYEQEVLARQRQRQTAWNWMKVGIITVIVGLGLGYRRVFRQPSDQAFHVAWRLFVYCFLGILAMSLAKLAFVVTSLKPKRRGRTRRATEEMNVEERGTNPTEGSGTMQSKSGQSLPQS